MSNRSKQLQSKKLIDTHINFVKTAHDMYTRYVTRYKALVTATRN